MQLHYSARSLLHRAEQRLMPSVVSLFRMFSAPTRKLICRIAAGRIQVQGVFALLASCHGTRVLSTSPGSSKRILLLMTLSSGSSADRQIILAELRARPDCQEICVDRPGYQIRRVPCSMWCPNV
jgi:hypothetical protein